MTLTFDLSTLKVASESRVTRATSMPISVFLGLSVLDLGPMYATDVRQTSDIRRQIKASLNAPPIRGGGIITDDLTASECLNEHRPRSTVHSSRAIYCTMYTVRRDNDRGQATLGPTGQPPYLPHPRCSRPPPRCIGAGNGKDR